MSEDSPGTACPIEIDQGEVIELAHGGGGRLMRQLLDEIVSSAFEGLGLDTSRDSAPIKLEGPGAFTTDSYVVDPLFFPGGDIGKLAVCGTVNDLAMGGAVAQALTISFILEEGLPVAELRQIVQSIATTAHQSQVQILAGDTKVVERGKGDGIYINSAGIGVRRTPYDPSPDKIRDGDSIILSGDIGRHGVAVMAARNGLEFSDPVTSDCTCLWPEIDALASAGVEIRCLRDLTRGGLAAALVEIAEASGRDLQIEEEAVSVSQPVRAACDLFGLDPMNVANEGRFVLFTPRDQVKEALSVLEEAAGRRPVEIGRVSSTKEGRAIIKSPYGVARRIHLPKGQQMPRIC